MIPDAQQAPSAGVNLLLPEGLQPEAAQRLARQLVAALEADPVTGAAIRRARHHARGDGPARAPGVLVLSGEDAAPPEDVPILNAFIGVLTVPMATGIAADDVTRAIREVPGAGGVRVEPIRTFGILPSPGERSPDQR